MHVRLICAIKFYVLTYLLTIMLLSPSAISLLEWLSKASTDWLLNYFSACCTGYRPGSLPLTANRNQIKSRERHLCGAVSQIWITPYARCVFCLWGKCILTFFCSLCDDFWRFKQTSVFLLIAFNVFLFSFRTCGTTVAFIFLQELYCLTVHCPSFIQFTTVFAVSRRPVKAISAIRLDIPWSKKPANGRSSAWTELR